MSRILRSLASRVRQVLVHVSNEYCRTEPYLALNCTFVLCLALGTIAATVSSSSALEVETCQAVASEASPQIDGEYQE